MFSIQQFKNDWQGKLVPSRGGITGQCVSLVQKWAEVNGVGGAPVFPVANARDMGPNTRQDAFTWIPNKPNDPTSKPIPGDVVVFSWNHTCLCEGSVGYTMTLFQQNDPTGSTAHSKNYSFNGCTGWLRLKDGGNMATKVTVETARIVHTEMEGWPYMETHRGDFDSQFMASWGGHDLEEMIWEKWNKNAAWREERVAAFDYYRTKRPSLEAQLKAQQEEIDKLNKQLSEGGHQDAAQEVADQLKPAVSFWQRVLQFLKS